MLRTRAQGLHPANKVAAAALSQYRNPNDSPGVTRFSVPDPTDSLWNNMVISPAVPISMAKVKRYTFYDKPDIDLSEDGIWKLYRDDEGSTTIALVEQDGGGVRFNTGSTSGYSYNFMEGRANNVQIESGKSLWLQFDMTISDFNPEPGQVITLVFGLTVDMEDPSTISPNHFTIDLANWMAEIDSRITVDGFSENASVDINPDAESIALADGGPVKVGIHIIPNAENADNFDIILFYNDEHVGTMNDKTLPTVPMHVYAGSYSHNDRITVNEIIIVQEADED